MQDLARKLIEIGADLREVDAEGMGIVHAAAMSNQCGLLVFFHQELLLSVTTKDLRGRTPLHLAALDASYNAAELLIAWKVEVNSQDSQGNTPLHLASLGYSPANYRIVRRLLLSGAKRNTKNSEGKTASNIAGESASPDIIAALVRSRQKPPSCLSTCNPSSTALRPLRYKLKAFVFYHLLQIYRFSVMVLFVLPGRF